MSSCSPGGSEKHTHKAKYRMEYTDNGWKVQLLAVTGDLIESFADNLLLKSDEAKSRWELVSSIFEKAHKQFFPHLPLDKAAWNVHGRNVDKYREHIVYKSDGTTMNAPATLKEILPHLPSWPVDWYWKSAFPILRDITAGETKHFSKYLIHIYQIRQWVFVCGYKENENREKVLAFPPIFGRSERLYSWDQYALYLPFFKKICQHYNELSEYIEPGSELEEFEHALTIGRHDVIYRISEFDVGNEGGNTFYDLTLDATLELEPYHEKWSYFDFLPREQRGHDKHTRVYVSSRSWEKKYPIKKPPFY